MASLTPTPSFEKFDAALALLDWSPFSMSHRSGYDPSERIYQVGELEFRVKETQQGYTDGYGLVTYLANGEDPEDPETLHRVRGRILEKLEEAHKVQLITKDSQRRTLLLQEVWENQILPEVLEDLEYFQLTNYDLVVQDNSFRLHLGDEPRIDGYKVDDYIILRGFFYPLEVTIYALYINKLFQFFGMLHEPSDKDWDGAIGRVQLYIDRFYGLAKKLQVMLETHLRDEQFLPTQDFPHFTSFLEEPGVHSGAIH